MTEGAELWLLNNREALVTDWERCIDQIKELGDQIRAFADALIETLRPALEAFVEYVGVIYVALQRTQLEIALVRRWDMRYGMAHWLSERCPKRWLPKLKPELWEWDEEQTVT